MAKRPEYDLKATGENLKYYRKKMHLSVEQVRQFLCISSVQAIYKWEKGECFPLTDNFFALMELYKANPLDVLVRRETSEDYEKQIFLYIECTWGYLIVV